MFESIEKNKKKTIVIFVFVTLFMMIAVYFVAHSFGFGIYAIPIAIVVAVSTSWSSYYFSDRMILSVSGAYPAGKVSEKKVRSAMEGLCIAAGLPMPRVYIINDKSANAFATGRDPYNSVVCVTTGLLEKLDYYELEAVLAHELAHIANRDTLLTTVVTAMVGIVFMLSDLWFRGLFWSRMSFNRGFSGGGRSMMRGHPALMIIGLLFILLAPLLGHIMKMLLSQNREYLADATAVQYTRNPSALTDALIKLSGQIDALEMATCTTSALYIVNPFGADDTIVGKGFAGFFPSHPPIHKRIVAIRNLR
jgi:heat shock protein HtpX